MKNKLSSFVLGLSTAVVFSVFAAVPHQFTAGTPARASEVNANFSNLDARLSTQDTKNTVQDAAIEEVDGRVADLETTAGQPSVPYEFVDSSNPAKVVGRAIELDSLARGWTVLSLLTPQGDPVSVVVSVTPTGLESPAPTLSFESNDCSGTPFAEPTNRLSRFDVAPRTEIVRGLDGASQAGALMFVASGAPARTISGQSKADHMNLAGTSYAFECQVLTFNLQGAVPMEFYENLYDTYTPPFGVLVK